VKIQNKALLSLQGLLRALRYRAGKGVRQGVKRGSRHVYDRFKDRLLMGQAPNGPLKPVEESTMNMPIRFASDRRIRRSVNPSRNKPIQATGRTINEVELTESFGGDRVEYRIQPGSALGDKIFATNRRLGRDPFIPSEADADTIERYILKEIESAI